jgi:hypothetical protein
MATLWGGGKKNLKKLELGFFGVCRELAAAAELIGKGLVYMG